MGRPQEIDINKVLRLSNLGYTHTQIAKKMGFTRQGITKAIKRAKQEGEIGVEI